MNQNETHHSYLHHSSSLNCDPHCRRNRPKTYDGAWSLNFVTQHGACDSTYNFDVNISNGIVSNPNLVNFRGKVTAGGLPIINQMSAAGIVTLPGIMTGQILAGLDPVEAVKYQIFLMFLLAGGSGLSVLLCPIWRRGA